MVSSGLATFMRFCLIMNIQIFIVLLLQNIIRNGWRRYHNWRRKHFDEIIERAIVSRQYEEIPKCRPEFPGDKKVIIHIFIELIDNFSGELKEHIVIGLARLGYLKKLHQQIIGKNRNKRYFAIETFGKIGSDQAIKEILGQLSNKSHLTKAAAIRALARIRYVPALPQIFRYLSKMKDFVTLAALLHYGSDLDDIIYKGLKNKVAIPISDNLLILAAERKHLKTMKLLNKLVCSNDPKNVRIRRSIEKLSMYEKGIYH